jgi:UDP-glucuronate 4-epimerase
MNKNVLVTGGAGFIGFHLALALKKRGDTIIVLDNFNDYYSPALKESRAEILKQSEIPVIRGDICNAKILPELIESHGISHICHLAAQAGVRYSLVNPQAYIDTNITGFLNVLEACRHFPAVKLTYASSSSVYGENKKVPFSVDDPVNSQASLYGVTKRSNELMAQSYHHLYGISVTGLRFFTVYGPWGRPDMAIFSFSEKIRSGKTIDVYNFGKMQRDFTYIDDIVQGTVAAIDLESASEIFNLGNEKPEELETLITALETKLGIPAKKNYLPMQDGDVHRTYSDISKSRELLNFKPQTSLDQGLDNFLAWYLEKYELSLQF